MNHRPERAYELFLPIEEETALAQLHLFHAIGNRSKQVKQVNGFPQDELFQALETGHQKYELFYHRINRAVSMALKQQKGAPNA